MVISTVVEIRARAIFALLFRGASGQRVDSLLTVVGQLLKQQRHAAEASCTRDKETTAYE